MKIWCDVCGKNKASFFCSADEAALCDDCDPRVHHANKLASKHQRFSLLQPSSSSAPPLCDICQEKKALLFCQQDRAILCIDCDVSIHTANELTQKHDRFLLSGVRLSTTTTTTSKNLTMSGSARCSSETVPAPKPQNLTTKMLNFKAQPTATVNITGGGSTSSISEYLTEMLPGWQVEDLLDSSLDIDGFSKLQGSESDLLFLDTDLVSRTNSYDNMGLWVPQAPPLLQPSAYNSGIYGANGLEGEDMGRKVSRKRMNDGFIVPEISQQSKETKKFRAFC